MRTSHALPILALFAAACGKQDSATAGASPLLPTASLENRVIAGGVMPATHAPAVNPNAGDSTSAKEGGQLFTAMNCDGCHGGGATGWVGPSLNDGRWRYGGNDADVFLSIYNGRPKGMPSFGGTLPPTAVWKLVTYLKSLPPPKDLPTESW